ncbi:MAG: 3-dehydroquinate synthase [Anaerolineae bacterium]
MADRIRVTAPGGDYDIYIAPGLLANVNDFCAVARTIVVTNSSIAPIYGEKLVASLLNAALVLMLDGEQYKNLETISNLYSQFVDFGLDRNGTVIALGGGVVGDTAGFAAATYMRGVRLLQIPTSLLAMVDSSVGGKVGVDLPQGKNLVGAFKQPDVVLIDPDVLTSLPDREWRCGMAEVIKHGLLADESLLDQTLWSKDTATELVRRAVQVKVDIVEKDPYEQNIRAHLNLGHTFAHAIERVSKYSWLHGEAVGVGLVAAARLSYALHLTDAALTEEIEDIVFTAGLPTRLGNLDPNALLDAMATDKKWLSGRSRFVLLSGLCKPTIVEDVPKETVISVLKDLAG